MSEKPFEPSSVTKPIQLLAAWLIGLIIINASFLAAAAKIENPSWGAGFLLICAAFNVPLFLISLFLLQTKFRPEMQEDTYYSRYLERRSSETQSVEVIRVQEPVAIEHKTQRPLARKTEKTINMMDDGLWVNDLIPSFHEIVSKLNAEGISVDKTFGSTGKSPEVPNPVVLSVGAEFSPSLVARVVNILGDNFIDAISPSVGSYNKNRMFIGSYLYREYKKLLKPLSGDLLIRLKNENLTRAELDSLIGLSVDDD